MTTYEVQYILNEDSEKEITIQDIVDEYELPVCIQKEIWTDDFYYVVEKIDGNYVKGTGFKRGKPYPQFFRKYKLCEKAKPYGDTNRKKENLKAQSFSSEPSQDYKGLDPNTYKKYEPIIKGFVTNETVLFHPKYGKGVFTEFIKLKKSLAIRITFSQTDRYESFLFPNCINNDLFFSERDVLSQENNSDIYLLSSEPIKRTSLIDTIDSNLEIHEDVSVIQPTEVRSEVNKDVISYVHEGINITPNSKLGNINSNVNIPYYSSPPVPEKSCDNCMLNVNGTCSTVRKQLCEDYRAVPYISQEEKDNWPAYGDATAMRLGLYW